MSAAARDGNRTARNKLVRLLKDLDVRESADDIDDLVDAERLHADEDDDFGQTSKAGDTEEPSDSDDDEGDAQGTRGSSPYRPSKGVPYERYAVMEKRAVQVRL